MIVLSTLAVGFATANAVLFLGLHSGVLVEHTDLILHTLLLAMSSRLLSMR